jgi:hypothetical protein
MERRWALILSRSWPVLEFQMMRFPSSLAVAILLVKNENLGRQKKEKKASKRSSPSFTQRENARDNITMPPKNEGLPFLKSLFVLLGPLMFRNSTRFCFVEHVKTCHLCVPRQLPRDFVEDGIISTFSLDLIVACTTEMKAARANRPRGRKGDQQLDCLG